MYARRNEARKVLVENFIEGIDYVLLRQNTERKGRGGHNKIDYMLSVRCLEFFIARKDFAVKIMERKFIDGIDYQSLCANGQNSKGGRPALEYQISTSCLEYFLVRKVY